MDTITRAVLEDVGRVIKDLYEDTGLAVVHTVTVILNGAHGGADVVIQGFSPDGDDVEVVVEVY